MMSMLLPLSFSGAAHPDPLVGALPLVLPLLGYTWCLGIRFVAVTVGFETPLLLVHLDEGN